MRTKWKLTLASLKMFFRQREAIIWTLLLPVFMILLFGLIDLDGNRLLDIGVIRASQEHGAEVVKGLQRIGGVALHEENAEFEMDLLRKGRRALVLKLNPPGDTLQVTAFVNSAFREESEIPILVVRSVLGKRKEGSVVPEESMDVQEIAGRSSSYIDFLVPGVISMSIMQMGIFGVAFSFVSLKKRGILRRLRVTPLKPADFIVAQILTRIVVVMVQISILLAMGVLLLDVTLVGNVVDLFLLGGLGVFVFLATGFAIAGVSKSEDQVAPLSNVIAMPMILLSGVFFDRSHLPGLIHSITDFLPLTYLADGMRLIVLEGAGVVELIPNLAGLVIWGVVASIMAVRLFRWE
jgi:ABC-2 type transport system permease protein